MTEVTIAQDTDVIVVQDDAPSIVVTLDDQTEIIQTEEQGPPGPQGPPGNASIVPGPPGAQGPQGPPGLDGNTVLYGAGPPAAGLGVNGNFYIDTTSHVLYGPKAGGAWPAGTSLVGPQGPQGIQGIQGVPGVQGPQGVPGAAGADGNTVLYGPTDPVAGTGVNGNFYINTTTHYLFGPKAAGAWPAGTSLIGPQGPPGATGAGGTSVYISDTPPVGVADNSLWWQSSTGTLFIRYNDGDSTAWIVAAPATLTDLTGAVRYDLPQGLASGQQQQARQNIFAAPFDALAYGGLQVNGSMDLSLGYDNSVTSPMASGSGPAYWADGWQASFTAAATLAVNCQRLRNGSAPVSLPGPPGLANSLSFRATTGLAVLAAGDFLGLMHPVEGVRIRQLAFGTANASPVTVAFMVWSTVAGSCPVTLQNDVTNRAYTVLVNIPNAGAWNFCTATFPGDVAGTWLTSLAKGARVVIGAAIGSSFLGTAGAWTATNTYTLPGATNFMSATGNVFAVTGFGIWPGNEAPSAARLPFIMRPYADEMILSKRYFQIIDNGSVSGTDVLTMAGGYGTAGSSVIHQFARDVEMRTSPTMAISGPPWAVSNCGQPGLWYPGPKQFSLYVVPVAGGAYQAQMASLGAVTSNARL